MQLRWENWERLILLIFAMVFFLLIAKQASIDTEQFSNSLFWSGDRSAGLLPSANAGLQATIAIFED